MKKETVSLKKKELNQFSIPKTLKNLFWDQKIDKRPDSENLLATYLFLLLDVFEFYIP